MRLRVTQSRGTWLLSELPFRNLVTKENAVAESDPDYQYSPITSWAKTTLFTPSKQYRPTFFKNRADHLWVKDLLFLHRFCGHRYDTDARQILVFQQLQYLRSTCSPQSTREDEDCVTLWVCSTIRTVLSTKKQFLPDYRHLALLWDQDLPDLPVYLKPEETSAGILDSKKDTALAWMENRWFLEGRASLWNAEVVVHAWWKI